MMMLILKTMLSKIEKKINETHKQVTVNHHSSETPTVLDRIDDVQMAVGELGGNLAAMGTQFSAHVIHSIDMDRRLINVEDKLEK